MRKPAPVVRSFVYNRPTTSFCGGKTSVFLAVGVALLLGATGAVGAHANDRILPKVPQVTSGDSVIEGDALTRKRTRAENNKTIVPELKGLLLLSDPGKVAAHVQPSSPLTLVGLPHLEAGAVRAQLEAFIGKPLSFSVMDSIAKVIVDYYREQNRPLVDVTFPEQSVSNGYLQVLVTESRIDEVDVSGQKWFSPESIRAEVRIQKGDILDSSELKDDLDFLNNNPFRHVDAVLDKGKSPGTTDMFLRVTDRNPLRLYAGYDNSGSVATGRARWNVGGNYGDVWGRGHIASYQFTSSSDFWVEDGKFMNRSAEAQYMAHSLSYTLPLPWRDFLTISGSYSRSHPMVNDINFDQIGEGGQATIRYDRHLNNFDTALGKIDHQLSFSYDYKTTNNNLEFGGTTVFDTVADLHQFSVGYRGGLSDSYGRTTVSNDFIYSPGSLTPGNAREALENMGVAFAKAHYFYDRLTVDRKTSLPEEFVWGSRARVQFSTANLLPSEQLGSNIYEGIRGYTDQPAGSQGFILSQELYFPSFSPTKLMGFAERDMFQPLIFWELAQFADVKRQPDHLASYQLQSLGIGFRYNFAPSITTSLDYAHQLQAQPGRTRGDFALISASVGF